MEVCWGGGGGGGWVKTKVINLKRWKAIFLKKRGAGLARKFTSVNKIRLIAFSRRSDCGDSAL